MRSASHFLVPPRIILGSVRGEIVALLVAMRPQEEEVSQPPPPIRGVDME